MIIPKQGNERGEKVEQKLKKAPAATEAKKEKCCVCLKTNATLQNEDSSWICENCAQIMSEFGHELSLD